MYTVCSAIWKTQAKLKWRRNESPIKMQATCRPRECVHEAHQHRLQRNDSYIAADQNLTNVQSAWTAPFLLMGPLKSRAVFYPDRFQKFPLKFQFPQTFQLTPCRHFPPVNTISAKPCIPDKMQIWFLFLIPHCRLWFYTCMGNVLKSASFSVTQVADLASVI